MQKLPFQEKEKMNIKKIFAFLLFFQTSCISISDDPFLITVVIMVKNEASVICQTLQPLVDGGIKSFLVYDTGSTDGTQNIAQNFFKKNNLFHTKIIEEPFIDFSTSRNKAITYAEKFFPKTTFILMPDAEWYMSGVEELLDFCQQEKNSAHNSYYVTNYLTDSDTSRENSYRFSHAVLFRPFKNIKFEGVVHEGLNVSTSCGVPENCFFEYRPNQSGQQKTEERWRRDEQALLQSLEKNPSDAGAFLRLGYTYHCLSEWENAYASYTKRLTLPISDGENFLVELRLGDIVQHIPSECAKASQLCCPAIEHYLRAHILFPHRAEPLVKIAEYYLKKDIIPLAFLFSLQASRLPYPTKDIFSLPIEGAAYNITRYDILGTAAWYVQEYELGEWAIRQALAAAPENKRLHNNLKFYINRSLTKKEQA